MTATPQKSPEELLSEAVARGDRQEVRRLLAEGADPLWQDGNSITAFHYAAALAGTGILEDLLAAQKDGAAAHDEDGATPMHYAARMGRVAAMELLHARGASVNATEKDGRTPLMHAAHHDRIAAIGWLLKKKAAPNAQDDKQRTALHYAVSRRHLNAAMALVGGGAEAARAWTAGFQAISTSPGS